MTIASPHYHATSKAHLPGDVIGVATGPGSYSARAASAGNGWVDQLLDGRPVAFGKPPRANSAYCCPELTCCARYAEAEPHLRGSYSLYEVIPGGLVHAAPMVLVGRIARRRAPDVLAGTIADEYWSPRHPWRFIEVLAEELEVVRELPKLDPTEILVGDGRFQDDRDLAVKLGW